MALMEYNANPILLREGGIYLDGVQVYDGVSCEIVVTPNATQTWRLGEVTPDTRWDGATIKVSVTRRRATKWLEDTLSSYLAKSDKGTPEFKIQGISNDENSDYYSENGSQVVTAVGCVPTSDITVLKNDANGGVREDTITFAAKSLV